MNAQPLYSEELEKVVLGMALHINGMAAPVVALGRDIFGSPASRMVFDEIERAGAHVDFMLICERLLRAGEVPAVFISECQSPTATTFAPYVEELREFHRQRKLRDLSNALTARTAEGIDSLTLTAEMQGRLEEIASNTGHSWETELDALRFDPAATPPEERCIYSLGDAVIATPGNILAISAQAKQGKTAFMGAVIASTMNPHGDCLGVQSNNAAGGAVLLFDTEQSERHFYDCVTRSLVRAGRSAPAWLRAYRLKPATIAERRRFLVAEMKRAKRACGFIHSVILDGVADFVMDPNDPGEAFAFIQELGELADEYETALLSVLHENPGSEPGKTRGHLGSQLERKAESNLRLAKDGEGITVVFSEKSRGAHIPKESGPRFQWSDEAKMHVTCDSAGEQRETARMADFRMIGEQVFSCVPAGQSLAWKAVMDGIKDATELSYDGCRKKLAALTTAGVVRKDSSHRYWRGK